MKKIFIILALLSTSALAANNGHGNSGNNGHGNSGNNNSSNGNTTAQNNANQNGINNANTNSALNVANNTPPVVPPPVIIPPTIVPPTDIAPEFNNTLNNKVRDYAYTRFNTSGVKLKEPDLTEHKIEYIPKLTDNVCDFMQCKE